MGENKNEKLQMILVPLGVKQKLKEQFNTSYPTVRAALNGKSCSNIALQIRKAAVDEYRGVEMKNESLRE